MFFTPSNLCPVQTAVVIAEGYFLLAHGFSPTSNLAAWNIHDSTSQVAIALFLIRFIIHAVVWNFIFPGNCHPARHTSRDRNVSKRLDIRLA